MKFEESTRGEANGPPEAPNEVPPPANAPAPGQPPYYHPPPTDFPVRTYDENPITFPAYPPPSPFESFPGNVYQGPYQPQGFNGRRSFRPPRYEYRPHYHDQQPGNGSDSFPRQPYQYRGRRPFNRYEGDNFNASFSYKRYDRQNDTHNGNYTPTFNNDYYDSASPDQQYYQDPSYNQQYNAPPFGEQPYAYPPQQYYYNPSAVADPNNNGAYNGPQYDQPPYGYQQQYAQPGPSSLNSSNTLQSSSSKKDRRGRKKKKSTPTLSNNQTTINSFPQPQSNPPQQWNANYPAPQGPQDQWGSHYAPPPENFQNQYPPPNVPQHYPPYGQSYDNWPPQHVQHSQLSRNSPLENHRKAHNIDFKGLDLNYDPEEANDFFQTESVYTQTDQHHSGKKVSKRAKKMQSVTGSQTLAPEYGDYNPSELLEDSEETPNQRTFKSTNATKHSIKEINHNTHDPKELKKVRTPPDKINYNTNGNRPYLHTDPYNAETLYKEHVRAVSETIPRSYHTPYFRHRKFFATAKLLNLETAARASLRYHPLFPRHRKFYFEATLTTLTNLEMSTNASSTDEKHEQRGKGKLSEYLDNIMPPESTTFLEDEAIGENISESFLNRWLSGEKLDQKNNFTSTSLSPPPFTLEERSGGRKRTTLLNFDYEPESSKSPYPPPLMAEHRPFGYERDQSVQLPSNFEQQSPYPPPLMPEHRVFDYRRGQTAQPPSIFEQQSPYPPPHMPEHKMFDYRRGQTAQQHQSFYPSPLMSSGQPRSTFDRGAFLASEFTTEHWLLTGRSKVPSTQSIVRKVSDSSTSPSDYKSIPWLPPLFVPSSSSTGGSTVPSLNPSHSSSSSIDTTTPTLATPSSSGDGNPLIKNHHHRSHLSPSLPLQSSKTTTLVRTTMPSPTPATPSSSSDDTPHIKNHHHDSHRSHHKHHESHHSTLAEDSGSYHVNHDHSSSRSHHNHHHHSHHKHKHHDSHHSTLAEDSGSHHAKHHHSSSHSQHNHHHHHKDTSSNRRKRDTENVSSSIEDSSSNSESNPIDVSNAKEYCAWVNQQRYLQSIERRKKEDRKHQKFSPPPLLKEMEFRSVNPEYQQTPYWTGSTSYVWLPGGKKKKVIDLPDESYGLLIEDSEEWWQAQRREAKRLRAIKDLHINVEGERKHRQQTHEKEKKSRIGKVFRFVKSIFGFGDKKKKDDLKSGTDERKPEDKNDKGQGDSLAEDDGDRRGWNRYDRRFPRPRNFQDRNFNKPNFRNYQNNPEQGYQPQQGYQPRYRHYGGPGGPPHDHQGGPGGPPENQRYPGANQNYHRNPNFNAERNDPSAGDQKNNKQFHYKPYHENYNHPDNPDNKPKDKQEDKPSVQTAVVNPWGENSNTRSMDSNTRSPDSDTKAPAQT